jgi:hypothetical protein
MLFEFRNIGPGTERARTGATAHDHRDSGIFIELARTPASGSHTETVIALRRRGWCSTIVAIAPRRCTSMSDWSNIGHPGQIGRGASIAEGIGT